MKACWYSLLATLALCVSALNSAAQAAFELLAGEPRAGTVVTNVTANLISYWNFNETSGATADDSIGANDFTLNNMEDGDWVAVANHNTLVFDGSNETASKASPASLDIGVASIALWASTTDLTIEEVLFSLSTDGSTDDEWFIEFRGDSVNEFIITQVNGGAVVYSLESTANAINDNDLHHIAVTCNASTIKLYVDAVEIGLTAAVGANDGTWWNLTQPNANLLTLSGLKRASFLLPWKGSIGSPRIYSSALTAAEVLILKTYQ